MHDDEYDSEQFTDVDTDLIQEFDHLNASENTSESQGESFYILPVSMLISIFLMINSTFASNGCRVGEPWYSSIRYVCYNTLAL